MEMETAYALFKTSNKTFEIPVRVASNPEQIAKGLMGKYWFPDNQGVYFKLGKETSTHSFWMLNTHIPLSIAFINSNGQIIDIQDMEPNTLDAHAPSAPFVGAIEVNKGWFAKNKVNVGDHVEVNEKAHPVRLGEEVGYLNGYGTAHHDGLKVSGELIPWANINKESLEHLFPRTINLNKSFPKKFEGFKSVSFVRIAQALPNTENAEESQKKTRKKSPASTPTAVPQEFIDEYGEEKGSKLWHRGSHEFLVHGVNLDESSNKVQAALTDFFNNPEHEGVRHKVLNWYHYNYERPLSYLTQKLSFPKHQASGAIAALSPVINWNSTSAEQPHNNNVDEALNLAHVIHGLSSDDGFELTQDHINLMNKNHQSVLLSTPGNTASDAEKSFHKKCQTLQVPTEARKYKLDELSDEHIALLKQSNQSFVNVNKAVKLLTSTRRKGATPLRFEDVASDQARKTSAFEDNGENPHESKAITIDRHIDEGYFDAHCPTSSEPINCGHADEETCTGCNHKNPLKNERLGMRLNEISEQEGPGRAKKGEEGSKKGLGYRMKHAAILRGYRQFRDAGHDFDLSPHQIQSILWYMQKSNHASSHVREETIADAQAPRTSIFIPPKHQEHFLGAGTGICDSIHKAREAISQMPQEEAPHSEIRVSQRPKAKSKK